MFKCTAAGAVGDGGAPGNNGEPESEPVEPARGPGRPPKRTREPPSQSPKKDQLLARAKQLGELLLPSLKTLPLDSDSGLSQKKLSSFILATLMVANPLANKGEMESLAAKLCGGISATSVRRWYAAADLNEGKFFASLRGKHPKVAWLLEDVVVREYARQWIRNHSRQKGKPNMKARQFAEFLTQLLEKADAGRLEPVPATAPPQGELINLEIDDEDDDDGDDDADEEEEKQAGKEEEKDDKSKDEKLPVQKKLRISVETARQYLHRLGFGVEHTKKHIYYDGHEREDVRADRKAYLKKMEEYSRRAVHVVPTKEEQKQYAQLPKDQQPVIFVFQDECIFYTNIDEEWAWCDDKTPTPMKRKSDGAGIMVTGYLNELDGLILARDATGQPDYGLFEYGRDHGYWTSPKVANSSF